MEAQRMLVEDIKIGDTLVVDGHHHTIVGKYKVNGEGRGFITKNEEHEEVRLARTCGLYEDVIRGELTEKIEEFERTGKAIIKNDMLGSQYFFGYFMEQGVPVLIDPTNQGYSLVERVKG